MLIVATQDPVIVQAAQDPARGAPAWGALTVLPPGPQGPATAALEQALAQLAPGEPLCLSAHGNDGEVGDAEREGWGWSVGAITVLFASQSPPAWLGPVLIHACAEQITNFSAALAVDLFGAGRFGGMWCYGYNRSLPADAGFPAPATLQVQVDLQGTQVEP